MSDLCSIVPTIPPQIGKVYLGGCMKKVRKLPKKKLPKTVTLLGRKFTVMSGLTAEQITGLMPDKSSPLGAMCYSKRLILIQTHEDPEEELVTFFHECGHAIQYIVGLALVTHPEMAEVWCESMANGFYDAVMALK